MADENVLDIIEITEYASTELHTANENEKDMTTCNSDTLFVKYKSAKLAASVQTQKLNFDCYKSIKRIIFAGDDNNKDRVNILRNLEDVFTMHFGNMFKYKLATDPLSIEFQTSSIVEIFMIIKYISSQTNVNVNGVAWHYIDSIDFTNTYGLLSVMIFLDLILYDRNADERIDVLNNIIKKNELEGLFIAAEKENVIDNFIKRNGDFNANEEVLDFFKSLQLHELKLYVKYHYELRYVLCILRTSKLVLDFTEYHDSNISLKNSTENFENFIKKKNDKNSTDSYLKLVHELIIENFVGEHITLSDDQNLKFLKKLYINNCDFDKLRIPKSVTHLYINNSRINSLTDFEKVTHLKFENMLYTHVLQILFTCDLTKCEIYMDDIDFSYHEPTYHPGIFLHQMILFEYAKETTGLLTPEDVQQINNIQKYMLRKHYYFEDNVDIDDLSLEYFNSLVGNINSMLKFLIHLYRKIECILEVKYLVYYYTMIVLNKNINIGLFNKIINNLIYYKCYHYNLGLYMQTVTLFASYIYGNTKLIEIYSTINWSNISTLEKIDDNANSKIQKLIKYIRSAAIEGKEAAKKARQQVINRARDAGQIQDPIPQPIIDESEEAAENAEIEINIDHIDALCSALTDKTERGLYNQYLELSFNILFHLYKTKSKPEWNMEYDTITTMYSDTSIIKKNTYTTLKNKIFKQKHKSVKEILYDESFFAFYLPEITEYDDIEDISSQVSTFLDMINDNTLILLLSESVEQIEKHKKQAEVLKDKIASNPNDLHKVAEFDQLRGYVDNFYNEKITYNREQLNKIRVTYYDYQAFQEIDSLFNQIDTTLKEIEEIFGEITNTIPQVVND